MKHHTPNIELISFCGLYCGNCGKYKNGKCPGCAKNEKASWCKIRTCCLENNYKSCSDCPDKEREECKKLNNFMGKFFSVVFNSDRLAGLQLIKDEDYSGFAEYMVEHGKVALPRRKK
jgi:hypothetical protein